MDNSKAQDLPESSSSFLYYLVGSVRKSRGQEVTEVWQSGGWGSNRKSIVC